MSEALVTARPGFELRPLPPLMRGLNVVMRRRGTDGLTPEQLTRAAARQAGLPPKFAGHVEIALERLCRSVHDEGRLHWFGRSNYAELIVTGLAVWLGVQRAFHEHPELEQTPLRPPLIVVGLPRSGTTHMHRLLAAVDDAQAIPMYKHFFPLPRVLPTQRLETELKFLPWRIASRPYGVDAIHYVRPGLPDECNFGMRIGMRSMIFWAMAPSYSYLRWLLEEDLREAYQDYRRILLLHQAQAPGKRLTLKCPHHLAWLPALHEALPEALVVQTHRDPVPAVASECKLILSLHGVVSESLDWRRTVEYNRHKVSTFARRSVEFADSPAGARIKHVDYRELVADPLGVVRAVHEHFNLPFGEREAAQVVRYADTNTQHKHGKNNYSLAQFELDADVIRDEFRAYRARFLPES